MKKIIVIACLTIAVVSVLAISIASTASAVAPAKAQCQTIMDTEKTLKDTTGGASAAVDVYHTVGCYNR